MKTISGKSVYSWTLVLIQFLCIIILLSSGPAIASHLIYLIIEIIGFSLGVWAVFVTNPNTLNIFPEVRIEASLIGIGPYRFIRHPMYLALILFFLSLILDKFSLFRFIIYLILVVDLLIKIEYEEKILINSYSQYLQYQKKTRKLIPYIY